MSKEMLDYVSDVFDGVNLNGMRLIGSQHLLGSTADMIEHLMQRHSLDPQKIHLLGKCYSTHPETAKRLQKKGVNIHPWSTHFDAQYSFDSCHSWACADLVKNELNKKNGDPVIILDDGGFLIPEIVEMKLDWVSDITLAAEQTSSGWRKNEKLFHAFGGYERTVDFPFINIARSSAKLILESPFIAEKIIEEFEKKVHIYNFTPQQILIIGKGPIGTALAEALRQKDYTVETYDKQDQDNVLGRKAQASNVIFGATGENILPSIQDHIQTNTMLISASSSDREFGGRILKESYTGDITDCHQDLLLKNGVMLLNCGFPLNFTGEKHSVEPRKIQLTRALIMAAILSGKRDNMKVRERSRLRNFGLMEDIHDSLMQRFQGINGN